MLNLLKKLEKLEGIKERVEDLEDLIYVEQAGLVELKKILENLKIQESSTNLDKLKERIENLEDKIERIDGKLRKIEIAKEFIDSDIEAERIEKGMKELRGKIEKLEEELAKKADRVEIEKLKKIEKLDEKIREIELELKVLKKKVSSEKPSALIIE